MTNRPAIFHEFRPAALQRAAAIGRWLGKYWFRFEIRGLDNLPDGPCLIVGNHSGFGFVEELMFATVWHDNFTKRRAWGLIHDYFYSMPIVGKYYRRIGAIPASHENAHSAFDEGDTVLVFPGGDRDCCRPFYEPRTVDFGQRRGYVRLAIEAGVPIVPLATVGSHWTYTFLPGGKALASIPWVRRLFRTECVPLPSALFAIVFAATLAALGLEAWWVVGVIAFLALLPTPVRVTSELGAPIDLGGLTALPVAERNERGHKLVWGELQRVVAELDLDHPSMVRTTSSNRDA